MRYKSGDCTYRVKEGKQVGTIVHNELTAVQCSAQLSITER
jgi:hypothetical protein